MTVCTCYAQYPNKKMLNPDGSWKCIDRYNCTYSRKCTGLTGKKTRCESRPEPEKTREEWNIKVIEHIGIKEYNGRMKTREYLEKVYEYDGREFTFTELCEFFCVKYHSVRYRIEKKGMTVGEAIEACVNDPTTWGTKYKFMERK